MAINLESRLPESTAEKFGFSSILLVAIRWRICWICSLALANFWKRSANRSRAANGNNPLAKTGHCNLLVRYRSNFYAGSQEQQQRQQQFASAMARFRTLISIWVRNANGQTSLMLNNTHKQRTNFVPSH